MRSISSLITIETCEFHGNTANEGGVLSSDTSTIKVESSNFFGNDAHCGGVMSSLSDNITIEICEFHENTAKFQGSDTTDSSTMRLEQSDFHCNNVTGRGGVLYFWTSTITISDSTFTNNTSPRGAVIYAEANCEIHQQSYLLLSNNLANKNAVIFLHNSEFIGHDRGNVTFSNNQGSLVIRVSDATFRGDAMLKNNTPPQTTIQPSDSQEGGAITAFKSNLCLDGKIHFINNQVENGGAMHSTESTLHLNGRVSIESNMQSSY